MLCHLSWAVLLAWKTTPFFDPLDLTQINQQIVLHLLRFTIAFEGVCHSPQVRDTISKDLHVVLGLRLGLG